MYDSVKVGRGFSALEGATGRGQLGFSTSGKEQPVLPMVKSVPDRRTAQRNHPEACVGL